MASFWYNAAKASSNLDWENDTLEILLLKDGIPTVTDPDHDTVAAVLAAAAEADATNYSRQALAGRSETIDDVNDKVDYSAANTTFTSLGGAVNNDISHAVIYKVVTNDSDSVPLVAVEFTAVTSTDGNNFVVQWATPIGEIS